MQRPFELADTPYRASATSFIRALRAENRSENTLASYSDGLQQFEAFLIKKGLATDPGGITRAHLEQFITGLLKERSGATVLNRFRSLKRFFGWLVAEGELKTSPMEKMRPPSVPENPPPVLRDSDLKQLLKACEGQSFDDRRDMAIIRLLAETPMRRGELGGLTLEDLDLDNEIAWVTGKGSRRRPVPFGHRGAAALDRYLRVRAKHRHGRLPFVWIGTRGRVTGSGIYQIVENRARKAGLDRVFVHLFRHTFSHLWRLNGGEGDDLMRLAGWRSPAMLTRYGASAASARAQEAYRRLGLGDRL